MEILLRRNNLTEDYTEGDLYVNGTFFCHTLEDPNRDLNKNGIFDNGEKKISGNTCIPYGEYDVKVTPSPKFGRNLPRLFNVPSFDGILIHRGNSPKDTAGCILVGERQSRNGMLINSTPYEVKLTYLIKATQNSGEKITIKII